MRGMPKSWIVVGVVLGLLCLVALPFAVAGNVPMPVQLILLAGVVVWLVTGLDRRRRDRRASSAAGRV